MMAPDRGELFNGVVHFTAGLLAFAMGLHNLREACSERRKPRHVVNALIYLAATPFEAHHTYTHWSRRDG